MTLGLLGRGAWGKLLEKCLTKLTDDLWVVGSDEDYRLKPMPDWVFIATPNQYHFEHAAYFLRQGVNVFLEKPGTLSSSALRELIDLARQRSARLYVNDVFSYREDVARAQKTPVDVSFLWTKSGESSGVSVVDRLSYHHFYLLHRVLAPGSENILFHNADTAGPGTLSASGSLMGKSLTFRYHIGDQVDPVHQVFGRTISQTPPENALLHMLQAVLAGRVSYAENHAAALWATDQSKALKRKLHPSVLVVGGGVFGASSAIELAASGCEVVLAERHTELMREASSINQYRVHRGYHYPRSTKTARDCHNSHAEFERINRPCITDAQNLDSHYAIARDGSKTNPQQYEVFLEAQGLPYSKIEPLPKTALTVRVRESLFDPHALKKLVGERLRGTGVDVRLGWEVCANDFADFDYVVLAAYASINALSPKPRQYRFQLCEKPVLQMPADWSGKSVVIMDGPFMCIDPLAGTDYHVMGHVVHAVHSTNTGLVPQIPEEYCELLNRGVIEQPGISNIDKFIESAKSFFPDIVHARHIGSMFTIRTVLASSAEDDARPTLVEWADKKTQVVFSGKICTSVAAAKTVAQNILAAERGVGISKLD